MPKESLQELGISKLDDLVDPDFLERIKRRFREVTGIDVVVGTYGLREVYTQPDIYRFCAELSQDEEFRHRCWDVYFEQVDARENEDGVFSFPCHIGMRMFGAKIKVEDETIGFMGGCQVRPSDDHITPATCRSLCERFRYRGDPDALFASAASRP